LIADDLAIDAEFFSFGTNDLTQTALGISRDDAGQFMRDYADAGIYPRDPFITVDIEGVGALVQMGCDRGRKQRPNIKLGVCGEHGGDPDSVDFFEKCGLDYVSCSPFRVPVARLAAAQATIRQRQS
jgi:pyruvate,orthophosphate dikinase